MDEPDLSDFPDLEEKMQKVKITDLRNRVGDLEFKSHFWDIATIIVIGIGVLGMIKDVWGWIFH